jgi:hypothetical protein
MVEAPLSTHLTQEALSSHLYSFYFLVVLGARQELLEEPRLLGESWYEKYIWLQYDLALILSKYLCYRTRTKFFCY